MGLLHLYLKKKELYVISIKQSNVKQPALLIPRTSLEPNELKEQAPEDTNQKYLN